MASQLRAGSQMSSGVFSGFATQSQYIEERPPAIPTQPHHEVVSSSQLPGSGDQDCSISTLPDLDETDQDSSIQDDVKELSQREERLAKAQSLSQAWVPARQKKERLAKVN